jgi:hypothetical protein
MDAGLGVAVGEGLGEGVTDVVAFGSVGDDTGAAVLTAAELIDGEDMVGCTTACVGASRAAGATRGVVVGLFGLMLCGVATAAGVWAEKAAGSPARGAAPAAAATEAASSGAAAVAATAPAEGAC